MCEVQAARMLHYLGDHILMLTSMNLRDYLRLKVEIQGTSGEGSVAVKSFRSGCTIQVATALRNLPQIAQPNICKQPGSALQLHTQLNVIGSCHNCLLAWRFYMPL